MISFQSELFNFSLKFLLISGLQMAKEELAKLSSKDKGTRPKVLFLITDGSQSLGVGAVNPAIIANEIRNLGVHIFVIGIGTDIKTKELEAIVGKPANLYLASDFSQLQSNRFVKELSDVACKAGLWC